MTSDLKLGPALRCSCGATLEAPNVNVGAGVATCAACNRVFSVAAAPRADLALPRVIPDAFEAPGSEDEIEGGYRARPGATQRVWRYRWFAWTSVALIIVGVIFTGMSSVFIVGAIASAGVMGLLSLLLPHFWVGICVLYWGIAHLVNRTTITVSGGEIRAVTGPLPWPGVTRRRSEILRADHSVVGWGRGYARQYAVRLVDHGQRARKLLGGLTEEEARYLSDGINEALIADEL